MSVESVCETSKTDQLRPRLAYLGLARLWAHGGCTPQLGLPASYSREEYPLCGVMMGQLRRVWLSQRRNFASTPPKQREALVNSVWLAELTAMVSELHGDGDCALQGLLHERLPTLCPKPPEHMMQWVAKEENATGGLYPPVCTQSTGIDLELSRWLGTCSLQELGWSTDTV